MRRILQLTRIGADSEALSEYAPEQTARQFSEMMADTPTDVLVAGYEDIGVATTDFDALIELVEAGASQDRGRDPRHARERMAALQCSRPETTLGPEEE